MPSYDGRCFDAPVISVFAPTHAPLPEALMDPTLVRHSKIIAICVRIAEAHLFLPKVRGRGVPLDLPLDSSWVIISIVVQ